MAALTKLVNDTINAFNDIDSSIVPSNFFDVSNTVLNDIKQSSLYSLIDKSEFVLVQHVISTNNIDVYVENGHYILHDKSNNNIVGDTMYLREIRGIQILYEPHVSDISTWIDAAKAANAKAANANRTLVF